MTSQDPAIYITTNYDRDSIALLELAIQQLEAGNAEKHIAGSSWCKACSMTNPLLVQTLVRNI